MGIRIRILVFVHGLHQFKLAQLVCRVNLQSANQLHLIGGTGGCAEAELHRIRKTVDIGVNNVFTCDLHRQILRRGAVIGNGSDGDVNGFAIGIVFALGRLATAKSGHNVLGCHNAVAVIPFTVAVGLSCAAHSDGITSVRSTLRTIIATGDTFSVSSYVLCAEVTETVQANAEHSLLNAPYSRLLTGTVLIIGCVTEGSPLWSRLVQRGRTIRQEKANAISRVASVVAVAIHVIVERNMQAALADDRLIVQHCSLFGSTVIRQLQVTLAVRSLDIIATLCVHTPQLATGRGR